MLRPRQRLVRQRPLSSNEVELGNRYRQINYPSRVRDVAGTCFKPPRSRLVDSLL